MKTSLIILKKESIVSRSYLYRILLMLMALFAVCYIGISIYEATSAVGGDGGTKPHQGERPQNLPDATPIPIPIAEPDADDDNRNLKYVTYTKYNPLTKQYL